MKDNKLWFQVLSVLFWLLVWEAASRIAGSVLLLPSPVRVFQELGSVVRKPTFLLILWNSLAKIWIGFFLAFALGIVMGSIGFYLPLIRVLLRPLVTGMKSIPIAAFIILALIWIGPGSLTILTSVMVTFPIIYINTMEGLGVRDHKMLEMAAVFGLSRRRRWWYLDMEALHPFLLSGAKAAIGMSWKSGVAAEVIGIPRFSIGEQFYNARLYLDTTELFAWTIVVVALSILTERIFLLILDLGRKQWEF